MNQAWGSSGRTSGSAARFVPWIALTATACCFGLLLFKHISYPLIWNDEGETVMYGSRVLEYGFPKVHGPKNIVYENTLPIEATVHGGLDAYIGTTWGHFYFASLGLWLAERVDDPFERTARLRLPFALAGFSGLVILVAALAPALPARWRVVFAALFFGLSCFSVSLILHLREARYYSLLVLLSSAVWIVYLRRFVHGSLGGRASAIWLFALLVLIFNTFYPAYFALAAGLGLDRALAWLHTPGSVNTRSRGLARDLAPFLLSFVVVLPLLWFFDTLRIAGEFSRSLCTASEAFCSGASLYLTNLRETVTFLLLHELLGPLLVAKLGLLALTRFAGRSEPAEAEPLRAVTRALWISLIVYVLVLARNPAIFERYFTLLGPWITAVFLLDCARLFIALGPEQGWGRLRASICLLVAGALAASLIGRWPLVTERWYEVWHRYRGPLDVVIPFLAETYGETENLVIATNYESTPFMYYLGSRVIVQWNPTNLDAESRLRPDVVIARRGHPRAGLDRLVLDGSYERAESDVRDSYYNNIPELFAMGTMRAMHMPTHLFRTLEPRGRADTLVVLWLPPGRPR